MNGQISIADYGRGQLSRQLDVLVFEMHQTRRLQDVESVHKLRVAIRRFRQGLRVFEEYFPNKRTKKIRRDIRKIRYLAGDVRTRDIAIEMIREAQLDPQGIVDEREQYKAELIGALSKLCNEELSVRWRSELGLA
jgi:CHAD domain-containing protein